MQLQSDPMLGYTRFEGRDYLVRQLNDHKATLDVTHLDEAALQQYAEVCGELLARGHARSGDPGLIQGYIGKGKRFREAMLEFAHAYAAQSRDEWQNSRRVWRSLCHRSTMLSPSRRCGGDMGIFDDLLEAAKRGDEDEVKKIVSQYPELLRQRDERGATVLHHAAFAGHRAIAEFLIHQGAEINARDSEFGATPAGWAIEYLREMGGFLAIELDDLAFAIERGDAIWVARLLRRFPALRRANNAEGAPFSQLAERMGDPQITRLFRSREQSGD